jgi:hypothetical protein
MSLHNSQTQLWFYRPSSGGCDADYLVILFCLASILLRLSIVQVQMDLVSNPSDMIQLYIKDLTKIRHYILFGIIIENIAPFPLGLFCASILPSWDSMIFFDTINPKPVPPESVETNFENNFGNTA